MIFLIFLVLYLLPVLPVARRIHYVRTRAVPLGTIPARKITKEKYSTYVYSNGFLESPAKICQNCGGAKDYHAVGSFSSLADFAGGKYTVCDNFETWDQKRMSWPEQNVYKHPTKTIPVSLLLGTLWPYFISAEIAKRTYLTVDPDWSKFAVEYHGVETKDEKIARLEAANKESNDRTARILAGVDKVKTIEELDALVKG